MRKWNTQDEQEQLNVPISCVHAKRKVFVQPRIGITYSIRQWAKELGTRVWCFADRAAISHPMSTDQLPEVQQTVVRTFTGFDDSKLWQRFVMLDENPQTKTILV